MSISEEFDPIDWLKARIKSHPVKATAIGLAAIFVGLPALMLWVLWIRWLGTTSPSTAMATAYDVLRVIVWPASILAIVWLFKKEIRQRIANLKRITAAGVAAEFYIDHLAESAGVEIGKLPEGVAQLFTISPKHAIKGVWRKLYATLQYWSGGPYGDSPHKLKRILSGLIVKRFVTPHQYWLILQLSEICQVIIDDELELQPNAYQVLAATIDKIQSDIIRRASELSEEVDPSKGG